jgi:hypothetical protein
VRGWRATDAADPTARCRSLVSAESLFRPGCTDGTPGKGFAVALRRERSRIGSPGYDLTRHWMLARALEGLRVRNALRPGPFNGKGAAPTRGDALR